MRAKFLDDQDEKLVGDYSEKDLSGLKVTHAVDDFQPGEAMILTLKDIAIMKNSSTINEDVDELENIQLTEAAKIKKNLDLKKKNRFIMFLKKRQQKKKKIYCPNTMMRLQLLLSS